MTSLSKDLSERIAFARINVASYKITLASIDTRIEYLDTEIERLSNLREAQEKLRSTGPALLARAEQELASLTLNSTYDARVGTGARRSKGRMSLEARAATLEAQLASLMRQISAIKANRKATI